MARVRLALIVAVVVGLPQLARATVFELIQIDDPVLEFTGGSLSTGATDGTIELPLNLQGNKAILDLAIVGSETFGTVGTELAGTLILTPTGGGPNLLEILVKSIVVTGLTPAPNGSASLQLGGIQRQAQSEVQLIGGTAMAQFGNTSVPGQMFLSLSQITGSESFYGPLGIPLCGGLPCDGFFSSPFTADASIQVQLHTPEPGTGLLLGASLAGIAALRRRRARR